MRKASSKSSYSTKKWCKHSGARGIVLDGIYYSGASRWDRGCVERRDESLLIALDGSEPQEITLPTGFSALRKHIVDEWRNVMWLPTADGETPPIKDEFWVALHATAKKQGIGRVIFSCIGGHGRTGLCLAAMCIVIDKMSLAEAVTLVRGEYCDQAVETAEQIFYLAALASGDSSEWPDEVPEPSYKAPSFAPEEVVQTASSAEKVPLRMHETPLSSDVDLWQRYQKQEEADAYARRLGDDTDAALAEMDAELDAMDLGAKGIHGKAI